MVIIKAKIFWRVMKVIAAGILLTTLGVSVIMVWMNLFWFQGGFTVDESR